MGVVDARKELSYLPVDNTVFWFGNLYYVFDITYYLLFILTAYSALTNTGIFGYYTVYVICM